MSYGKMNSFIDITERQSVKDAEGFSTEIDVVLASVRAYREGRHGNEKWANRAQFSEATDLFRFRCIPGIAVTTAMTIVNGDGRFEITSVEDVKGRGMYIEVLAKEVKQSRSPQSQMTLWGEEEHRNE
ncbi:MAG: head-tail adaptor protein [Candidatus Gastranaerophilaceae bacterium]|nr:head-tail adaptor protein [Christensenellales bacterium]